MLVEISLLDLTEPRLVRELHLFRTDVDSSGFETVVVQQPDEAPLPTSNVENPVAMGVRRQVGPNRAAVGDRRRTRAATPGMGGDVGLIEPLTQRIRGLTSIHHKLHVKAR